MIYWSFFDFLNLLKQFPESEFMIFAFTDVEKQH